MIRPAFTWFLNLDGRWMRAMGDFYHRHFPKRHALGIPLLLMAVWVACLCQPVKGLAEPLSRTSTIDAGEVANHSAPPLDSRVRGNDGKDKPPNILFILSDDHRWDFLSCVGHPFVETPRLDLSLIHI